MNILSKPTLATRAPVSGFLCPLHFHLLLFLFLKQLKREPAMDMKCEKLTYVPLSLGHLYRKAPQSSQLHGRGWNHFYYEIGLCPRFPVRRESKSEWFLPLFGWNCDVFHKPRNHELIFVEKKPYFFLTLLNGETKPQAFGIDGLQNA